MAGIVDFEEGWRPLATSLAKQRSIIDGSMSKSSSEDDNMQLYMYVLPSMRQINGETLLKGLVDRWRNHKKIVISETRFFFYLDRYYISQKSLVPLEQLNLCSFRDQVYSELKDKITRTVVDMINDERDGKVIDRDLLKDVLDVYVQIGLGMECYEVDFENAFRESTRNYYSNKAQTLILECNGADSPEYMLKAVECLQAELERVSHYLHSSTEPKLMQDLQSELMITPVETHTEEAD
uniref:Cullin N-terminal domain-containing protein n=1 Tax=Oryza barthii TaxID=65489 RepID=A0A0D3HST1_9ORYZ